jgi:epoxyqueuosine reductase
MLSSKIRSLAENTGIDVIGFTDASSFDHYIFEDSLRISPIRSMPDAQSIIVAGIYIGGIVLPEWDDCRYGRTSRLYLSSFFLDVIKPLRPIAKLLEDEGYKAVICDSSREEGSILPLKLAAVRAGLGWQGKHSLLISEKYGSFLALGGIISNAKLDYNSDIEKNRCAVCHRCQDSCPMNALNKPYLLNRDYCLSNLLQTKTISEEAKLKTENRIGDCEICQDACPWNFKHKKNPLNTRLTVEFQKSLKKLQDRSLLSNLLLLDEKQYKNEWGECNTDIPFSIFRRNICNTVENCQKKNSSDA